ncbi:MAG: hypothetical protein ACJAWV_001592 [Flammeovirgaceae bacterium]|jgi:hypothetical protein
MLRSFPYYYTFFIFFGFENPRAVRTEVLTGTILFLYSSMAVFIGRVVTYWHSVFCEMKNKIRTKLLASSLGDPARLAKNDIKS